VSDFNAKAARSKRPCPLWVDAFQRDTQHLEADEVGAYMLILMAMWTRETCDFPDDDTRLARVSRVSTRLWKSRIGPVIREFFSVENGTVFSKRLREEATYVERQVTHQSNRKTGEKTPKALKTKDVVKSGDKPPIGPGYYPSQQPNNPTLKEKEDKSSSSLAEADFYEKYLKAHPKPMKDSKIGEEAFDALVKAGEDPEKIVAAAAAYAAAAKTFSNPNFIQQSDNFLDPERGKWRDHAPKAPGPPLDGSKIAHFWADQIKSGRAFGLTEEIAHRCVSQGLVTQEQIDATKGYK
jgi:uncharacterized protein YdaU (DUF1376 family)